MGRLGEVGEGHCKTDGKKAVVDDNRGDHGGEGSEVSENVDLEGEAQFFSEIHRKQNQSKVEKG